MEGQPVTEFVDERYRVNTLDSIGDIPEPRPDFR